MLAKIQQKSWIPPQIFKIFIPYFKAKFPLSDYIPPAIYQISLSQFSLSGSYASFLLSGAHIALMKSPTYLPSHVQLP